MPAASVGTLALVLGLGTVALGEAPDRTPVRIADTGTGPDPSRAAPPPDPTAPLRPELPASPPVRLLIPRIGVDAAVGSVGLNTDGTVEVPPLDRPALVGWYRDGAAPGSRGPAVLLGHYDTRRGPAVFHRVPELHPGDRIDVVRQDGRTVSYRVRSSGQFRKTAFPTGLVYGDTPDPQLRLITCGGTLGGDGHYSDNIVVLADLAGTA
ncbi:hypothetical protein KNE206_52070 [Kitasatospora sp. NE20-6]|uniref:class F sortase n=1 Tax=Kitasatospora sp. NE20-6 TaxID=2859066 RepID=UPI0034DC19F5